MLVLFPTLFSNIPKYSPWHLWSCSSFETSNLTQSLPNQLLVVCVLSLTSLRFKNRTQQLTCNKHIEVALLIVRAIYRIFQHLWFNYLELSSCTIDDRFFFDLTYKRMLKHITRNAWKWAKDLVIHPNARPHPSWKPWHNKVMQMLMLPLIHVISLGANLLDFIKHQSTCVKRIWMALM